MDMYAKVLLAVIYVYFGMLVLEWFICLILKKDYYKPLDAISGMSSGLVNGVKAILKLTFIIVSHGWLLDHIALFELPASPLVYVCTFIAFDLAYYWRHRWAHEINFLWNRHLIHHSSEEFNLASAMRQPISGFVDIYFFLYVPLALMGVPLVVMALIAPLHRFSQFWYHTRLIGRMGFLENIIVTPSHHRVHHAINKDYLDKNYSAIFIVWDKMFGTFQEERTDDPPVYGITKAVESWNPFLINFMHIWQLAKDSWRTSNWSDKFKIWYKRTGWRPADVTEKFPISYTEDPHSRKKYDTPITTFLLIWFFIQIMIHFSSQIHFLHLLAETPRETLLIYATIFGLSMFAYTALMDRHWMAVPFEVAKTFLGFYCLNLFGGWFGLEVVSATSTVLIAGYLVVSLFITLYYTYAPEHRSITRTQSAAFSRG